MSKDQMHGDVNYDAEIVGLTMILNSITADPQPGVAVENSKSHIFGNNLSIIVAANFEKACDRAKVWAKGWKETQEKKSPNYNYTGATP